MHACISPLLSVASLAVQGIRLLSLALAWHSFIRFKFAHARCANFFRTCSDLGMCLSAVVLADQLQLHVASKCFCGTCAHGFFLIHVLMIACYNEQLSSYGPIQQVAMHWIAVSGAQHRVSVKHSQKSMQCNRDNLSACQCCIKHQKSSIGR